MAGISLKTVNWSWFWSLEKKGSIDWDLQVKKANRYVVLYILIVGKNNDNFVLYDLTCYGLDIKHFGQGEVNLSW